jgi:hypothetical protein
MEWWAIVVVSFQLGELGFECFPSIATAEQLAASITFLLSDDGVNINGAILASDGGWSVQ